MRCRYESRFMPESLSWPHVIPANAGTRGEHMDVLGFEERGIQCKYDVRSTQHRCYVLCTVYYNGFQRSPE